MVFIIQFKPFVSSARAEPITRRTGIVPAGSPETLPSVEMDARVRIEQVRDIGTTARHLTKA